MVSTVPLDESSHALLDRYMRPVADVGDEIGHVGVGVEHVAAWSGRLCITAAQNQCTQLAGAGPMPAKSGSTKPARTWLIARAVAMAVRAHADAQVTARPTKCADKIPFIAPE